MRSYLQNKFGNPSNLYKLGREAQRAIEDSSEKIAAVLNCQAKELIFTGSATEANNLAIAGVARANKDKGGKIIISNVEHKGILAVASYLKQEGFETIRLNVGENGLINPEELKNILAEETILVSVTYADNETGSIQPVGKMAEIIKEFRKKHSCLTPYFHTDASQAAPYLDLDVERLGVDLMTLSGHKVYGPKGIGALYVKKGIPINRLRSGTENVPAIVGFGEAVKLAEKEKKSEYQRVKKLRDKLEQGIFKIISKVILNGHLAKRLPNFLNISILDIEGEALLLYLDEIGIYVNTGSACNSQSLEPSHILTALGRPHEYVHGSVRFTLGRYSQENDIDYVLKNLPPLVEKLRKISPLKLKLGKKKQ